MDSNRNALLALDLKVSIGTMGIGMGALIAGLFGMNVRGDHTVGVCVLTCLVNSCNHTWRRTRMRL